MGKRERYEPGTFAAAEKMGSLGGRVVAGPLDTPAGRIAVALDPQGAAFAIFAGDVDQ